MGITYFYIISKDVIKTYFQARYTSSFAFSLLYMYKIVFPGISQFSKFIKFSIYSSCNDPSSIDEGRGIWTYFSCNTVPYRRTRIELFSYSF